MPSQQKLGIILGNVRKCQKMSENVRKKIGGIKNGNTKSYLPLKFTFLSEKTDSDDSCHRKSNFGRFCFGFKEQ